MRLDYQNLCLDPGRLLCNYMIFERKQHNMSQALKKAETPSIAICAFCEECGYHRTPPHVEKSLRSLVDPAVGEEVWQEAKRKKLN